MLCVKLIFLALLVTGCYVEEAATEEEYDHSHTFLFRLDKLLKQKCLKNANETHYGLVLAEQSNLLQCFNTLFLPDRSATVEVSSKNFYENLPGVLGCLDKFGDTLMHCLDGNETYFKQLLVDGYEQYLNFQGKHLEAIRITGNPFMAPQMVCELRLRDHFETDPEMVCFKKSAVFGDHDLPIDVVTEYELCHDLKNIIDCYENLYTENCFYAPKWMHFQIGSMREGFTPCLDVIAASGIETSEGSAKAPE